MQILTDCPSPTARTGIENIYLARTFFDFDSMGRYPSHAWVVWEIYTFLIDDSGCWEYIRIEVLVNSHLFPLPCGAGSAVPREGFDLSVIILASLLVFPMLGCRHFLLRL